MKIAITVPYFYPREASDITEILTSGDVDFVHIRKPDAGAAEIESLIGRIDAALRGRLTLHDHFESASRMGAGGIHLNRRNLHIPEVWTGRVSRSLHSVEECSRASGLDYATLSPVFPSISKPGYKANFDFEELRNFLNSKSRVKTVALGGVTPSRENEVREMGFDGMAMLSAAWRPKDFSAEFRLQFITNPCSVETAVAQCRHAVEGGCRWVQLRWKDAPLTEFMDAATRISEICRANSAKFIIDDMVEAAPELCADGVHLGKNDMAVSEARLILGPSTIIGATANTPDDIAKAVAEGADYIGYGPFRFTSTKKNLSPVLGLEGYRQATAFCKDEGISLPIVAIGGITATDIPEIMGTGVAGVAVSGTIINAPDPAAETAKLINLIERANSAPIKH